MPQQTPETRELYRRGNLRFILNPIQRIAYDEFFSSDKPLYYYDLHRGCGKTTLGMAVMISMALRTPRRTLLLGGPTRTDLYEILEPVVSMLLEYCPDDVKPRYNAERGAWIFKNGSKMLLFGTKNADRKGRGRDVHGFFFDEAAFSTDSENTIDNVIMPRLLKADGKGLIATTAPEFPTHSILKYRKLAEERGCLRVLTLKDNPGISKEEYHRTVAYYGGEDNPRFRREMMCECKVDAERVVCDLTVPVKEVPDKSKAALSIAFLTQELGSNRAALLGAEVHQTGVYVTYAKNLSSWDKIRQEALGLPRNTVCMTDYDLEFIDLTMPQAGISQSPAIETLEGSIAALKTIIQNGRIFLCPNVSHLSSRLNLTVWDKKRKAFEPDFGGGTFADVRALAFIAAELQFASAPPDPRPDPVYQRHLREPTYASIDDILGRS